MMRGFSILLLLSLLATACSDSSPQHVSTSMIHIPATARDIGASQTSYPQIHFTETSIDLGDLVEGQKAKAIYTFENTGNAPLVIADVSTSCGCTVAKDWPREPISSGQTYTIEVDFDSRKRAGENEKSVFVVTNGNPSTTELKLKAWVIGPESTPASIPSIETKEPTS